MTAEIAEHLREGARGRRRADGEIAEAWTATVWCASITMEFSLRCSSGSARCRCRLHQEELQDKERYQTVYSKVNGSAAAPTAGLHFTPELLERIAAKGVGVGYVTLHVGLGTFRPVKEDEIEQHDMHSEYCTIPQETADLINRTKANGGRVICVGTTSCRTIESWAGEDGTMTATGGWTNIYIYPGYRFKVMDALVTNFHLPESTLIMLVSALAGREHVLAAYEEAVRERYRFFSFGDAMFIS